MSWKGVMRQKTGTLVIVDRWELSVVTDGRLGQRVAGSSRRGS